jgi:hypothetical protein
MASCTTATRTYYHILEIDPVFCRRGVTEGSGFAVLTGGQSIPAQLKPRQTRSPRPCAMRDRGRSRVGQQPLGVVAPEKPDRMHVTSSNSWTARRHAVPVTPVSFGAWIIAPRLGAQIAVDQMIPEIRAMISAFRIWAPEQIFFPEVSGSA